MNIGLLVIDVQKAFIGDLKGTQVYEETLMYINAASELFRKAAKDVFIIRDLEEGDSDLYDVVDDLIVSEKDSEIIKYHSNSFWQTDLEEKLKEKHIEFLVLCGNAAEYCILATFNGAKERGFKAAMLQRGVFANNKIGLDDLFINRPLISYEVLRFILNQ